MIFINKVLKFFGLYLCRSRKHQFVYHVHFNGGDKSGHRFTDSIIIALPTDIYSVPIKDIEKLIEIQTGFTDVFQISRPKPI